MKFFRAKNFNWKYILGEILLLFIGINLAIWFNDWNASKEVQKNKEIALDKIEGEIRTNLEQLKENSAQNQKVPDFFDELNRLKGENKNLILAPDAIQTFIRKYPEFIRERDSSMVEDGLFEYDLDTYINLEITDLSSIAWDISKSTGIFHEFGYDCLYQLQAMYNTQHLVKNELANATDALRNKSFDDLVMTLKVMGQLEDQLEDQYNDMLGRIGDCK
ncbi:hypothetical protein [Flagellimonas nanhaiensis]|uniref:Uncharacterized protein n=1 Tax=Flagellimonas nanhaiensis TaxID=2292706 RepID=A0A371JP46_9FLAO|nr:hypothetical protein [Allomuricauda nanhaiensis]RDY59275.1 hypothetical protein DX873_07710 [Allomuricauda nanhaiensis]